MRGKYEDTFVDNSFCFCISVYKIFIFCTVVFLQLFGLHLRICCTDTASSFGGPRIRLLCCEVNFIEPKAESLRFSAFFKIVFIAKI